MVIKEETANYEQAVVAAGEKNYSAFKDIVSNAAETKIKNTMAGFLGFLEKNQFKKD